MHTSNGVIVLMNDKVMAMWMLVPLVQIDKVVNRESRDAGERATHVAQVFGDVVKAIMNVCFTSLDCCETWQATAAFILYARFADFLTRCTTFPSRHWGRRYGAEE